MAPRVVAVNLVFGTFVRIVASASAQNVFAHATSMLVCHRCRQLGPLTTNLNRASMSRFLFLDASNRSCCRPALPNDSCGIVLYRGKNNHLEPESNDSFPPFVLLFFLLLSLASAVSFSPPDLIVDIWSSAECAGDFDLEFTKDYRDLTLSCSRISCLLLALFSLPSLGLHLFPFTRLTISIAITTFGTNGAASTLVAV